MYRRMFANGAYSVDVGDMKKLVSMACVLQKVEEHVFLNKILLHDKTIISLNRKSLSDFVFLCFISRSSLDNSVV